MRLILCCGSVLVVNGNDPCRDLCDFSGPHICTQGSEVILSDNGEVCRNYFYIVGGAISPCITYTAEYWNHTALRI